MQPSRLVVIGGGFTGVMAVVHAIRSSTAPLAVTIVEPARELGRGAAYGTDDPVHRINVPSDRMGVFEADPEGATRWLFAKGHLPDAASEDASGRFYVPRHIYGAFTRDLMREALLAAGERVTFEHRAAAATAVARAADGWRVTTNDGSSLAADRVALCHGHAAPTPPCPIDATTRAHPKFVANPWRPGALAPIAADDTVLVVGTGLTMADVVASLRARGHAGAITAISRRGLLPRGQGAFLTTLDLLEGEPAPTTALGLVRLVRRGLRRHGPEHGWQPVLDSARAAFPVLWTALPAAQRRAIARHVLPLWEVHRFRLAPQIEAALAEAIDAGGLVVERAGLRAVSRRDDGFGVALRRPGGATESRVVDAVVLCTGPEKNPRADPLIAGLLAAGLARLDSLGFGLDVDAASRVVDPDGRPWPSLLAFGPMTRASFGEMTGAPDIARHLERIAPEVFVSTLPDLASKGSRVD